MTGKDHLIGSAGELKPLDAQALADFREKVEALTQEMNSRMEQRPDILRLVGKDNLDMMKDNHRNHMRYIDTVLEHLEPKQFVETVLWVFRAYRSHGFQIAYWPAQLDTWLEIFKERLDEAAFAQVYPFYKWMLVNQAAFVSLSVEDLA